MKIGEIRGSVEDFIDSLSEFLVTGPLGRLTPERKREKEELKKTFLEKKGLFETIFERWRKQLTPLIS